MNFKKDAMIQWVFALPFLVVMPVAMIGILASHFGPGIILPVPYFAIALILLIISKIPQIRQGNLTTFGSKGMTRSGRILYRTSYVMIIFGSIVSILLFVSSKL